MYVSRVQLCERPMPPWWHHVIETLSFVMEIRGSLVRSRHDDVMISERFSQYCPGDRFITFTKGQ